jgi:hypothetical protein
MYIQKQSTAPNAIVIKVAEIMNIEILKHPIKYVITLFE